MGFFFSEKGTSVLGLRDGTKNRIIKNSLQQAPAKTFLAPTSSEGVPMGTVQAKLNGKFVNKRLLNRQKINDPRHRQKTNASISKSLLLTMQQQRPAAGMELAFLLLAADCDKNQNVTIWSSCFF